MDAPWKIEGKRLNYGCELRCRGRLQLPHKMVQVAQRPMLTAASSLRTGCAEYRLPSPAVGRLHSPNSPHMRSVARESTAMHCHGPNTRSLNLTGFLVRYPLTRI